LKGWWWLVYILTGKLTSNQNIIFQQKKIDLSKVTRIKKFADEITFLTPHEKLKISTKLIAREDLLNLQNLLASLDLEPQKNPFKKEILEIT